MSKPAISLVEVIFYIVIAGIVMSISVSSLTAARQRSYVVDSTKNLVELFQTARSKALSNLEVTFGSVDCTVAQFEVSFYPGNASAPATMSLKAIPVSTCSSPTPTPLQIETKTIPSAVSLTTSLGTLASTTVGFAPPNATAIFDGSVLTGPPVLPAPTSATFTLQTDDGRFPKIITLNSLTGIAEVQ